MTGKTKPDSRSENLTEDEIVAAAVRLIRADGISGLTMRKLSKELGKSHMAMYYYVSDKDALLDLVASSALAGIVVPEASDGSWDTRLRLLIGRIEKQLRANPGIGEILLERILSTDRGVLNATMEILVDAGFDDAEVLMAYATLHTYLFGRYSVLTTPSPSIDHIESDTVARVLPRLAALSGRDFFQFGVDTLIDGLHARLERRSDSV